MKRIAAHLLFAASLAAQTAPPPASPSVLTFTGSPLPLTLECTEDDIQWAGLTCIDEPCPVYIELSHAAGSGQTILIAGNFHTARATLYSLLLRSDDAGKTWREPFARLRGTTLDHLQMYDAQNVWVSGQAMQPIALDPFFLTSTDGGASWSRVPLFEEGTPGTIARFEFDSREHGTAIVDRGGGDSRYEYYETLSGGRAWSIRRRTSEAPNLKTPLPETPWRVRADQKAFRLEHLADGRWSPFTSFAIGAGVCREEHRELPPEPSPPEDPNAPPSDAVSEIQLTKDPDGKLSAKPVDSSSKPRKKTKPHP